MITRRPSRLVCYCCFSGEDYWVGFQPTADYVKLRHERRVGERFSIAKRFTRPGPHTLLLGISQAWPDVNMLHRYYSQGQVKHTEAGSSGQAQNRDSGNLGTFSRKIQNIRVCRRFLQRKFIIQTSRKF